MSEDLLKLEKAAMERWRNGDPLGFVEISAEDIIYIDPGLTKPICGLDEYKANMKQVEGKVYYQGSEFIDPKIVTIGDAAVLSYNYRSSIQSSRGETLSQTPWNATEVFFRRNGEWKIVHTHWSYIDHRVPDQVEVPLSVHSTPKKYEGMLAELMALESAAMERWRKGDPWGFVELYAPQVTYFDTGTPQRINGKEAMTARYKQLEGKIFYDVMDFVDPRIIELGEMVVLVYRFLSTTLKEDGSVSHRTPWNCSEVYARMQGGWKIIHNHWSLIKGERY